MRVVKYIPEKMYGFLLNAQEHEVFFHLRVFHGLIQGWARDTRCSTCASCPWADSPPPPILGEPLMVEMDLGAEQLRAQRVVRVDVPVAVGGSVDTFDASRGYGFIRGDDGHVYHLHRSEVTEGRIPISNQKVLFYAGVRQGKPRACHVKVC